MAAEHEIAIGIGAVAVAVAVVVHTVGAADFAAGLGEGTPAGAGRAGLTEESTGGALAPGIITVAQAVTVVVDGVAAFGLGRATGAVTDPADACQTVRPADTILQYRC